jgi:hypothetical protein
MLDQQQKQKTALRGSGDFDSDLSVSHEIKVPSVEDVLRAAKLAISQAKQTIAEQRGGASGCF